jgi:hypothetical protein
MEQAPQISDDFINNNTDFEELITALKSGFSSKDFIVPQRHHHDFPNSATGVDSTLLLMPAWQSGKHAGSKLQRSVLKMIGSVCPLFKQFIFLWMRKQEWSRQRFKQKV